MYLFQLPSTMNPKKNLNNQTNINKIDVFNRLQRKYIFIKEFINSLLEKQFTDITYYNIEKNTSWKSKIIKEFKESTTSFA